MKVKTSELTGNALDWAVSQCEGADVSAGLTDDERYSTAWSQGGPIIVREGISLGPDTGLHWWLAHQGSLYLEYGPTPLIAAMRCHVASKLGDEVEIPKELIND
jgi:hypothetical protein